MKKIMFNDLYGLTVAVLDGRKTMTRRLVSNGLYNQTDWKAVAEGNYKSMVDGEGYYHDIRTCGNYRVGEIVAVAQAYRDIKEYNLEDYEDVALDCGVITSSSHPYSNLKKTAGWSNKMFVRADLMPIKICITDVKVERLQDCSDDDILKEGIDYIGGYSDSYYFGFGCNNIRLGNSPREAFAALIDKISGKGTWDKNPFCFCYEFELVK